MNAGRLTDLDLGFTSVLTRCRHSYIFVLAAGGAGGIKTA